jgi:glycosyltransferase involved in cell wall biosynthesis
MNELEKTVLFISRTWPQPKETAAGWRMTQLINHFLNHQNKVFFACAELNSLAQSESFLKDDSFNFSGVNAVQIALNDDGFNAQISDIKPDYVVFDRFITEEQYGWRVRECCPKAVTILDTEDCHFLRLARANYIKHHPQAFDASACAHEALYTPHSMRELASIWRCDLTLIISQFEYQLLRETFFVPGGLLHYLPLAVDDSGVQANASEKIVERPWSDRTNFLWVGNRKHDPNNDSLIYLLQVLWPLIQNKIPNAALHIVGPYGSEGQRQLILKSKAVVDLGWVENLPELMINYRVNLAPVRFGAGLKGKIMQPLGLGLPTVCSIIGAEGLMLDKSPSLAPVENSKEFINKAIRLYTDEEYWLEASEQGIQCIKQHFALCEVFSNLNEVLDNIKSELITHRKRHFMGQILQHQSLNATKYMGRWLTLKNQPINPE